MRKRFPALVCALWMLAACQPTDSPGGDATPDAALPPGSDYSGAAFEFEEVVPGVYHARGTGSLAVGSHGAVIVNDDDVLLVESHISPAAARAVVDEIEAMTDKPVRYVVNTHYHFDHAHGNQIYPSDVHVIGHEVTREMLENGGSMGRSYELFVGGLPDQVAALEEQVAASEDDAERAELEARLAYMRNYLAGQQDLVPAGPNTTLSERMTLFRGDREIRLLFFGRGHTGGDVVVHLPNERVIITGDLLVPGLPYMGDGYLDDTLEHLKSLETGSSRAYTLGRHPGRQPVPGQGADYISAGIHARPAGARRRAARAGDVVRGSRRSDRHDGSRGALPADHRAGSAGGGGAAGVRVAGRGKLAGKTPAGWTAPTIVGADR